MKLTVSNLQLQELYQRWRASVQPWDDLANPKRYQLPVNPATAGRRVLRNLSRFQSNYFVVFFGFTVAAIFLYPILLVGVAVVLAALFLVLCRSRQDQKLNIYGYDVSTQHQYVGVGVLSIPFLWIIGAAAVIIWILSVSTVLSLIHSALYNSEGEDGRTPGDLLLVEHV